MTFVINLIGGPGSGKSTTAAGLFFQMKSMGIRCELVTEYAKELVYDENWADLKRQLHVLAEQDRRQKRLIGKVDFMITDSPILTSIAYTTDIRELFAVEASARSLFGEYKNINFIIKRVKPYAAYGRGQTEDEAKAKDQELINGIWKDQPIEATVPGDIDAPKTILRHLSATRLIF
jgi:predicted ATPase